MLQLLKGLSILYMMKIQTRSFPVGRYSTSSTLTYRDRAPFPNIYASHISKFVSKGNGERLYLGNQVHKWSKTLKKRAPPWVSKSRLLQADWQASAQWLGANLTHTYKPWRAHTIAIKSCCSQNSSDMCLYTQDLYIPVKIPPWVAMEAESYPYPVRKHQAALSRVVVPDKRATHAVVQQFQMWVLSLWESNPFTGVAQDHRKHRHFKLWLKTVAKLQLYGSNKSNFMVGGHDSMRKCSKGQH